MQKRCIQSVSYRTLINWEKEGLITPLRTPKTNAAEIYG